MLSNRIKRLFNAGLAAAAVCAPATVNARPANAQPAFASHAPRMTDTGMYIQPSRMMRYKGAKWDYEVRVALPKSYYTSNKSFPVLWILDGQWAFERGVSITSSSMGGIPEMIVVSIGSPPEAQDEVEKRRLYDFTFTNADICEWTGPVAESYKKECEAWRSFPRGPNFVPPSITGGAKDFLNFVADDVRSEITRTYRTNSSNTLWGFSGGGSFCGYTLLTRPEAFDRYICASSAWYLDDRGLFTKVEEDYASSHKDLKAKVFFSMGDEEIMGHNFPGIGSGTLLMAETLRLRHYPSLDLHVKIIPGGSHDGYGMDSSLYFGLKALFADTMPAMSM
jgi:predicted alpha/beta superfamily hydrolase